MVRRRIFRAHRLLRQALAAESVAETRPPAWQNTTRRSRDAAVRVYTSDAARLIQEEGSLGSLLPGKRAHIVTYPRDPIGADRGASRAYPGIHPGWREQCTIPPAALGSRRR